MEVLKPFLYDRETRVRALNAILDNGNDDLWKDCSTLLSDLDANWLDRLLRLRIEYRFTDHGSERLALMLCECTVDTYCSVTARLSYVAMKRLWYVLRPSEAVVQRSLDLLCLLQGPEIDAKTLFLDRVTPELDPLSPVIGLCSSATLIALLDSGRVPTDRHLLDSAVVGQFWLLMLYAPACAFSPWLLRTARMMAPGPVADFLPAVTR